MTVNSSQDIVNLQDIIERIEELESIEGIEDIDSNDLEAEYLELEVLRSVMGDVGVHRIERRSMLIRESYFTEYAQEYARDIGLVGRDFFEWPLNHINWEEAVEELKESFVEVDWDGIKFYIEY